MTMTKKEKRIKMKEKIKVGYIGLGSRGTDMLCKCFGAMKDVEITWVCDCRTEAIDAAIGALKEKGLPLPRKTTTDYREIISDPDVDAVVVMTGWDMHVKCAVESLKAGKYTAIEVGGCCDLSECYDLIAAYEETGVPLMMLENCCYGRREMMALRMVKEGLFGEVCYCAGAYHHFINRECLCVKNPDGSYRVDRYRLAEYIARNGEQYPTHELGPIAKVLGINRGNRMMTLTSMASKSRSLSEFMRRELPDDPMAGSDFKQGDIISTDIKCANGELIHLTLDTTLPRPFYSREFTVQGTRGMCVQISKSKGVFYLDGMPKNEEPNEEEFYEKYDHPLHRDYSKIEGLGGHGGIDWLVCRAFVESVKRGVNTPIDAYDTVSWMAVTPLSEQSVAMGGAPVAFPDFTRGKWIRREPPVKTKYSLDVVCDEPDTPIVP